MRDCSLDQARPRHGQICSNRHRAGWMWEGGAPLSTSSRCRVQGRGARPGPPAIYGATCWTPYRNSMSAWHQVAQRMAIEWHAAAPVLPAAAVVQLPPARTTSLAPVPFLPPHPPPPITTPTRPPQSTYCNHLYEHCQAINRAVHVVNLGEFGGPALGPQDLIPDWETGIVVLSGGYA